MAQKFFVPVTIQDLSSTGSDAINVFIDNESYARLKLEAGGRLVWGDGTGAGDVNLYRDSANVLKTDDKFVTAKELVSAWSSGDEGGEIQLALPQTNTTLSTGVTIDVYQNRLRFFENGGSARGAYIDLTAAAGGAGTNLLSGGGGATTLDGLTDVTAPSPSSGDFLKYNGTAWVNDAIDLSTDTTGSYVASLVAGTNVTITNNSGEGATPTVAMSGTISNFDSISTPDWIQFDTSVGSPASTEGKLQWDSDFGTLSFGLEGNNSVQQIGINQYAYCYNAEATTLTKGEAVYIFGGQGSQVSIKRASNSAESTSSKTLGLVSESITAGGSGYVCTYGAFQGIDTTAYNEGDILWLGSTGGTLTTTKPTGPNHAVFIGVVIKDAVGGEIWLRPQNGFELDELHNVSAASPTTGDFLKYNGTVWTNDAIDLGTDTTGSYVASLVAGTGVTLSNNSGEGATPTIAIGQAVGTTSTVTFGSVTAGGVTAGVVGSTTISTDSGDLTIAPASMSTIFGSSLQVNGDTVLDGTITVQAIREKTADGTISSNTLTCSHLTAGVFYVTSPSANFTVNVTSLPTDNGFTATVSIFVQQGATGYIPNALQIQGAGQTIKWSGGTAPTPTSSSGKIDVFTFTLIRRGSAWTVLGSANLNY